MELNRFLRGSGLEVKLSVDLLSAEMSKLKRQSLKAEASCDGLADGIQCTIDRTGDRLSWRQSRLREFLLLLASMGKD